MGDELTIRANINITPRMLAMLDEVAKARGVNPGQALADAIALLKVATDARAKLEKFVIQGTDGDVREINGL